MRSTMNILTCMALKFGKIMKQDMTMFNSECIFNFFFQLMVVHILNSFWNDKKIGIIWSRKDVLAPPSSIANLLGFIFSNTSNQIQQLTEVLMEAYEYNTQSSSPCDWHIHCNTKIQPMPPKAFKACLLCFGLDGLREPVLTTATTDSCKMDTAIYTASTMIILQTRKEAWNTNRISQSPLAINF